MIRSLWLVAACVACGAGLAAGRAVRSADTTCAWQRTAQLRELEALRQARWGDPVPFPPGLHEAFTPEGYTRRMHQVAVDCPDLNWKLLEIDCTEFPCFSIWDDSGGAGNASYRRAMECGVEVVVVGDETSDKSRGVVSTESGKDILYTASVSAPAGTAVQFYAIPRTPGRVESRLPLRRQLAFQRLAEPYGGLQGRVR